MRNDVHIPPANSDAVPGPENTAHKATQAGYLNSRAPEARHPAPPDRAHSLERTSDKTATGMIYDTPEDRGGIDSLTLSIIVVAVISIVLLIVFLTFFRSVDAPAVQSPGEVPNATVIDDRPIPEDPADVKPTP
jgi:hypothetical protein